MSNTVIVTGAKRSKGEYEGRSYDSTKVYVQAMLDPTTGDGAGFATAEYPWGTSQNFAKIASLQYPFKAEITLELVTTGKSSRHILMDLVPIANPSKA